MAHRYFTSNAFYPTGVSHRFIHLVNERFSGKIAFQILAEKGDSAVIAVGRSPGCVGRYDHILHLPKGALRRQRLLFENVQSRSGNSSCFERFNQGGFIDDAPAPS